MVLLVIYGIIFLLQNMEWPDNSLVEIKPRVHMVDIDELVK